MKLRWLALLAVGLRFITWTASAQDDNLPPVLSAADVFDDPVEIVETLPILNADDSARLLYYYDPAQQMWVSYPYPDEVENVKSVVPREDGTFFVAESYYNPVFSSSEDTWLFDPASGALSRAEMVCGRIKPLSGEWKLSQSRETGLFHLCFTETGPLTDSLPGELQPHLCGFWRRPPKASPDGRWVVFSDCEFEPHPVSLYSYDTTTGEVRFLGPGPGEHEEMVTVDRWADNLHPVIQFDSTRNPSFVSLYVADVSQSESMRRIFGTLRYNSSWDWFSFYENPLRYEWVPAEFAVSSMRTTESCRLHAFDLETLQEITYPPVSGVCGRGVPVNDASDDRLYRSVEQLDSDIYIYTATLFRFDPYTGDSMSLFSGEIEWLENVTPDGRFATLLMDDSGSVEETSATVDSVYWFGDRLLSPYRAIFDLTTQRIIYEFPLTYLHDGLFSPETQYLGSNTFLLTDDDNKASLLEVTASDTLVEPLPRIRFGPASGTRIPLWTDAPGESWGMTVYNAATGEMTPVIRPLSYEPYRVQIEWQSDDLLHVEVIDVVRTTDESRPFALGAWLVRVP
jgi:hypothetical protein